MRENPSSVPGTMGKWRTAKMNLSDKTETTLSLTNLFCSEHWLHYLTSDESYCIISALNSINTDQVNTEVTQHLAEFCEAKIERAHQEWFYLHRLCVQS